MLILKSILYAYVLMLCVYSIAKHNTMHPLIVLAFGFLYILTLQMKRPKNLLPWIRLIVLFGFHAVTHQSMIIILYLLSMSIEINNQEQQWRGWILSFFYALGYFLLSWYVPTMKFDDSWPSFLAISMLHFVSAFYLTLSTMHKTKQAEMLKIERTRLTTQDALTGLVNYEECHRRLEQLVADKKSLAFILIDCNDLKSMNTNKGFQAGNIILKQIADLLKILFSDAYMISRYGGDEFSIVLPIADQQTTPSHYKLLLESELPKLTGIQITYGISTFPYEGQTKDDLVLLAEHQLSLKKREVWLKREEHMVRAEKLRVVGELASGMAHEIRNPLTTVRGFLQISKSNDYNIRDWYSMIMDEIDRMSELTGEFLQFSKPHSTLFHIRSLQECLTRVISLTESEATRLGHIIRYQAPEMAIYILMDQDKMIQLILNLVKNAYEAIEDNGVIQLHLASNGSSAIMVIEDNGPGIPSEMMEKIFHPFYTTKESGTGLGLSICHKIVQEHEGTIEVESQLGIGTRFILTFPIAADQEQRNQAALS
ncbi:ATP-binding protein [Paenibacillus hexagrammi]|uniref:histidine kinase n=1 Tax=Paenibacillus hexagrammi TaxID=2908839 RepID=A0ABY3SMD5_9BACL|nr:ATP-binding protein [Paenibacillus sp. YPD9-1]UJF35213.1 ATP-binding protein [Paenibacillus sp. YPD9-1]